MSGSEGGALVLASDSWPLPLPPPVRYRGSGVRSQGSGFRGQDSGFLGVACRIKDAGSRVKGLG